MPTKSERQARRDKLTKQLPLSTNLYRSFKTPIVYYHFSLSLGPFDLYKHEVLYKLPGFNSSRLTADPLVDFARPEGDECPEGKMEVVYLRNVFKKGGCALGFRLLETHTTADDGNENETEAANKKKSTKEQDKNESDKRKTTAKPPQMMEWLFYQVSIAPWLDCLTDNTTTPPSPLFDVVATLDKGGMSKTGHGNTGNAEHIVLYESVVARFGDVPVQAREPSLLKQKGLETEMKKETEKELNGVRLQKQRRLKRFKLKLTWRNREKEREASNA
jgi:hypothetical protein